jgi:hypothetical protein
MFGGLAIAFVALFASVQFVFCQPAVPPDAFAAAYSFNTTNWLSEDGDAPIAFTNLVSVALWNKNALLLDTSNATPAFLNYNVVESDGFVNLEFDQGALRCVLIIDWGTADTNQNGTGPGQTCYLIAAGDWSSNSPDGLWSLFIDQWGSNIYLAGVSNSTTNIFVSAPISWPSNSIHSIAVMYSSTNSVLYLDGQTAATGGPVTIVPTTNIWTNGFFVGSDNSGYEQARGVFSTLEFFNSNCFNSDWSEFFTNGFIFTNNWMRLTNAYYTWLGSTGGFGPDSGGGGGFSLPPTPTNSVNTNYANYTNFWLLITNSPAQAYVSVVNTLSNITYEVLTNDNLASTNWGVWTNFVASNSVTPLPPLDLASNALFFEGVMIGETGTNGLPDWWCLEYFNTLNVDPYADPDGDGLCNLDEFTLGTNPTNAYSLSASHKDAAALLLAFTNYDSGCVYQLSVSAGSDTNTLLATITPTLVGTNYQIYSHDTSDTNNTWVVETNFVGTNTSTTVPIHLNGRTLSLIGGYGEDSDGDGLPDGYEVLATWTDPYLADTGFSGTSDGYKDPDGDGYSNLQEMYNGTNPHVWNPPQGPADFNVVYSTNGTSATLTWNPVSGNTNITILAQDDQYPWLGFVVLTNLPANQTSFVDSNSDFADGIRYEIDAGYAQGMSLVVDQNPTPVTPLSAALQRGPNGSIYLALITIPYGTAAIQLSLTPDSSCGLAWGGGTNQTETIPITSFTNGFYSLSESEYPLYYVYAVTVLAITSNSTPQLPITIADCADSIRYPFLDGSQVLKDNLIFTLQAQAQMPPSDSGVAPQILVPLEGVGLGPRSGFSDGGTPAFAFASYHTTWNVDCYTGFNITNATVSPLHPWEINALMAFLVWGGPTPTCYTEVPGGLGDSPYTNAPCGWAWGYIGGIYFDTGDFATNQVTDPCPSGLSSATNRAINNYNLLEPAWFNDITNIPTGAGGFGLAFDGAYLILESDDYALETNFLGPGDAIPDNSSVLYAWERYDAPNLNPEFYQFTTAGNLPSLAPGTVGLSNGVPVTNIFIAGAGSQLNMSAWLRYQLLNGNSNIYGYTEQYFDEAYKVDTNGNVTTNQTGILSPYGDFFATDPGVVALVTRTNADIGTAGVGFVNVIKLETDVNRDGVIDDTFAGPDNTSPLMPFRFWINDDNDSGDDTGNGIPGQLGQMADGQQYHLVQIGDGENVPIYSVHGTRDLVDYFPVYLNIASVTQIWLTNQQYTNLEFQLSQADGALRFVYTSLTPSNFMDYLRNTNTAESLSSAAATTIFATGVDLTNTFLQQIATNNQGVIIVEAWEATTQPLVLQILQNGNVLAQTSLYLSISGVEQMFRQKNLTAVVPPYVQDGLPDRLTGFDVPNEPDTDGRNFVFLHGYSVNGQQCRGAFSDVFKRMFWSGSHAKFYGISWRSYTSQGSLGLPGTGGITPDYHTNVYNAFLTASNLSSFLGTLSGTNVVAAHSLGNMLVLSALSDWNAPISQYYMIDAAVAMETIQGNAPQTTDMIYSDWIPYSTWLYSHEWNKLWPTNDGRSLLSWQNRLSNFHDADVFNFYSSGEEVLRDYTGDPPRSVLGALPSQIWSAILSRTGSYVWVWEEKGKGRAVSDYEIGSTHGGWAFNDPTYGTNDDQAAVYFHMAPTPASQLTTNQVKASPFFDLASYPYSLGTFTADLALTNSGGSVYATNNRNRILADAIPAMTLPIGANDVPALDDEDRNFNMQQLYENGWPADRMSTSETNNWHHSDFRQVAYTFTYQLYTNFVYFGNLK